MSRTYSPSNVSFISRGSKTSKHVIKSIDEDNSRVVKLEGDKKRLKEKIKELEKNLSQINEKDETENAEITELRNSLKMTNKKLAEAKQALADSHVKLQVFDTKMAEFQTKETQFLNTITEFQTKETQFLNKISQMEQTSEKLKNNINLLMEQKKTVELDTERLLTAVRRDKDKEKQHVIDYYERAKENNEKVRLTLESTIEKMRQDFEDKKTEFSELYSRALNDSSESMEKLKIDWEKRERKLQDSLENEKKSRETMLEAVNKENSEKMGMLQNNINFISEENSKLKLHIKGITEALVLEQEKTKELERTSNRLVAFMKQDQIKQRGVIENLELELKNFQNSQKHIQISADEMVKNMQTRLNYAEKEVEGLRLKTGICDKTIEDLQKTLQEKETEIFNMRSQFSFKMSEMSVKLSEKEKLLEMEKQTINQLNETNKSNTVKLSKIQEYNRQLVSESFDTKNMIEKMRTRMSEVEKILAVKERELSEVNISLSDFQQVISENTCLKSEIQEMTECVEKLVATKHALENQIHSGKMTIQDSQGIINGLLSEKTKQTFEMDGYKRELNSKHSLIEKQLKNIQAFESELKASTQQISILTETINNLRSELSQKDSLLKEKTETLFLESEQKRTLENYRVVLSNKVLTLESEKTVLQNNIRELTEKANGISDELSKNSVLNKKLSLEKEFLANNINTLTDEKNNFTAERGKLLQKLEDIENKSKNFERKNFEMETSRANLLNNIEDLNKNISRITNDKNNILEKMTDMEKRLNTSKKRVSELEGQRSALENDIQKLQETLLNFQKDFSSLQEKNSMLEKSVEADREKQRQLESENKSLMQRIENLDSNNNQILKERNSSFFRNSKLEKENGNLTKKIIELETEKNILQDNISKLEQELENISVAKNIYINKNSNLENDQKQTETRMADLASEITYLKGLLTKNSELFQAAVCEKENLVKKEKEYIRELDGFRTSISGVNEKNSTLLRNEQDLRNNLSILKQEMEKMQVKNCDIQQQLDIKNAEVRNLYSRIEFLTSNDKSSETEINNRHKEIETLKKVITEKETEKMHVQNKLDNLRNDYMTFTAEKVQAAIEEVSRLKDLEINTIKQSVDGRLQKEAEKLYNENETKMEQQLEKIRKDLYRQLESLNETVAKKTTELENKNSVIQNLNQNIYDLTDRDNQKTIEIESMRKTLIDLTEIRNNLSTKLHDIESAASTVKSNMENEMMNLQKQIQVLTEREEMYIATIESTKITIRNLTNEKNAWSGKVNDIQKEMALNRSFFENEIERLRHVEKDLIEKNKYSVHLIDKTNTALTNIKTEKKSWGSKFDSVFAELENTRHQLEVAKDEFKRREVDFLVRERQYTELLKTSSTNITEITSEKNMWSCKVHELQSELDNIRVTMEKLTNQNLRYEESERKYTQLLENARISIVEMTFEKNLWSTKVNDMQNQINLFKSMVDTEKAAFARREKQYTEFESEQTEKVSSIQKVLDHTTSERNALNSQVLQLQNEINDMKTAYLIEKDILDRREQSITERERKYHEFLPKELSSLKDLGYIKSLETERDKLAKELTEIKLAIGL